MNIIEKYIQQHPSQIIYYNNHLDEIFSLRNLIDPEMPKFPSAGELFIDRINSQIYMYTGLDWKILGGQR